MKLFSSLALMLGLLNIANGQTVQTITTSGTFTVPAGVTSIAVYTWGGGGGAGGSTTGTWFANGGGGGGAASAQNLSIPVSGGQVYTITIGAGGTAGAATGGNGGAGGTTTFTGTGGTVSAAGGSGGTGSTGGGGTHAGGLKGSTGTGTTIFAGGSGSAGNDGTSSATGITGTGGGGAGSGGAGVTPASTCAAVGTGGAGTYPGGTGGKNANCGTTTNLVGPAGAVPGGGGGGANCWTSSFKGGAGGGGQVILVYTCPNYNVLTSPATATSFCAGATSTVTLTSTTLAAGTYTVTYNTTFPTQTALTAAMVFAGTTGTFTVSGLTGPSSVITVTSLASGGPTACSSAMSTNNTATATLKAVSATPTVNSPICPGATSVSGTSTEATGSTVTVYDNGVSVATTTTITAGAWTVSGLTALVAGHTITATVLAAGKCISAASAGVVVAKSATPTVNSPICPGATSVSGTSTEATGSTVTVYDNGVSVGTTTTITGGAWTVSGLTALVAGHTITATVQATTKCISATSAGVVVAISATPTITTTPICASSTSVSGTSTEANGSTVTLYDNGVSVGTTTTISGGSWTISGLNFTSSSGHTITATVQAVGKCISAASAGVTVQAATTTPTVNSPICVGATSVSGTSAEANGSTVTVYDNGVPVGSTTIITAGSWTVSGLTALISGHTITATVQASGLCISTISPGVVVATSATPAITTSPICANTTSISGSSTEANGSTVTVYDNGVSVGTTTTITAGVWTVSGLTMTAGHTMTATVQATSKCISAVSAGVIVQSVSATPSITTSPICAGSTSVSGTSTEANGSTVTVYNNGVSAGTTTTITAGVWTVSGLTLTAGQTITATVQASGKCISATSAGVVVTATSATPVISAPLCPSATSVSGTSTEANGSTVTVYDNGVAVGTTTTITAGAWTVSGLTLTSGHIMTATVKASAKCISATSAGVTVTTVSAPTSVTASPTSLCFGGSTNLNAISAGNSINWWTAATGGTLLGSSASGVNFPYTPTTTIGSPFIYYAEAYTGTLVNNTNTYTYTGSNQSFTVPAGVSSITVTMWGAGGAGSFIDGSGGTGAYVKGTLAVTPGSIIAIVVGGGGSISTTTPAYGGGGAANAAGTGGGGGGYSGLFNSSVSFANALAVAGGGGGGGYYSSAAYGGGGGATSGTSSGTFTSGLVSGGGGTTSAGGAAGTASGDVTGTAGSQLTGGNGGVSTYGGGGGGGGYYGGGGGYGSTSTTDWSGAGGGGSSYLGSLIGVTNTVGATDATGNGAQAPGNADPNYVAGVGNGGNSTPTVGGDGRIVITYVTTGPGCPSLTRVATPAVTVNPSPTITSFSPTSVCSGTGTTITINGTNFVNGGTTVTINGTAATPVTFVSSTQITVALPAGASGTGNIVVTNTTGSCSATSASTFTINPTPAAPTAVTATTPICVGSSTNLNATSTGIINWYTAATGGTFLGSSASGANFPYTPAASGVFSYYAEAQATKPASQTFSYTGANQTFTVPAGVYSITVKLWGAGGAGASTGGSGGSGAYVLGTLAVTPGTTIPVVVGGGGTYSSSGGSAGGFGGGGATGGANSASGGGYSGIFMPSISQANAIGIAGGGAGGGYFGISTYGGAGGATTGSAGGNQSATWQGGKGATIAAGGAGGSVANTNGKAGNAGSVLQGGAGGNGTGGLFSNYYGGGGGGGYYGGGGGYGSNDIPATLRYSSGGGGGSSYLGALTGVTNTVGVTSATGVATQAPGSADVNYVSGVGNGGDNTGTSGGNGLVVITYNAPSGCTSLTRTAVSVTVNATTVAPTFALGATSTRCQGAGTVTYSASVTNTTGITISYTLDAASTAAGNSINAATGVVTYVAGWSGAATITATATSSGSCGTPKSSTHVATTNMAPSITTNPSNATACTPTGDVTFSVTATGTGLTYDWQVSTDGGTTWNDIGFDPNYSNATTSTLTVNGASIDVTFSGNQYRCIVRGASPCGSVTSTAATLTVSDPPAITTQPSNFSTCSTTSTFSVVASGTTPTYQWQVSTDGGTTWSNLSNGGAYSGVTTATLSIANFSGVDNNLYRVVVGGTAPCGSVTSSNVKVIITYTWTGATSTTWTVGSNWGCGVAPNSSNAVVTIPDVSAGSNRYPVLSTTAAVKDITINANASLTNTGTLQIAGTLTQNGTLDATAGTVEFSGTSAQTIPSAAFAPTNTISGLKISNAAGVSLGGALTLTNALSFGSVNSATFTTNDNLTLHSDSTSYNTARVADLTNGGVNTGNTITGNVMVERYINSFLKRAYHLLAPSVNSAASIHSNWQEGATAWYNDPKHDYGTQITGSTTDQLNGFDQTSTAAASLFTINYATGWVKIANTDVLTLDSKTGYLLFVRGNRGYLLNTTPTAQPYSNTTLRAKGPLVTGDVTFTPPQIVTGIWPGGTSSTGQSLVTNPYASPLDWSLVYTEGSNSTNFYQYVNLWDPHLSGQGAYVQVDNLGNNNNFSSTLTNEIQSGSAFFIFNKVNAPASFIVKEKDKSTTANIHAYTPMIAMPKFYTSLYYNDAVNGRTNADGTLAIYDNSYCACVDGNDALNSAQSGEDIAITRDGVNLSIEKRPLIMASDTLFIFMQHMKTKAYQWQFDIQNTFDPSLSAVLVDSYLGTRTPVSLAAETIINFNTDLSVPASIAANRFYIVFTPGSPLPVTITSIKAYQHNTGVNVDWTVSQQINMGSYEVEKSQDGRSFTHAGTVAATPTTGAAAYSFYDATPNTGANYYRVKVIDRSSATSYTNIVRVDIASAPPAITVYPNPVKGNTFTLQLTNVEKGNYTMMLINKLGQVIYTREINHAGGSGSETITLDRKVAQGSYELKIGGFSVEVIKE